MKIFYKLICLLFLLTACSSTKDRDRVSFLPELIYSDMAEAEAALMEDEYFPDSTSVDEFSVRTGETSHFYITTIYGKKFQLILKEKDNKITGLYLTSEDFSDAAELEKVTSLVKKAFVEGWNEPLQDSGSPKDGTSSMRVILWDIIEIPLLVSADYQTLSFSLRHTTAPQDSFDE